MIYLAISPILLLVLLLFLVKWPLVKAAPLVFLNTVFVGFAFWNLSWQALFGALSKGFFLSIDIALIVFGAIFFLNFLREVGALQSMQDNLKLLSPDRRVQAILLTWLFGGFIEGVAGFGTPAVTVAPLLVGIGFAPLTAITMALLANSTAVAFGAVGTPIRIGLAGLETHGVAIQAAVLSLIPGLLVPVMILGFMVRLEEGLNQRLRSFLQAVPWALLAGFSFLIPFTFFAAIGPEFPSIFGGAIGLVLAVISLRYGILVPKPMNASRDSLPMIRWSSLLKAFSPYIVLMILLLIGKIAFSLKQFRLDLGGGLWHSFQLFNPGFAFLTTVVILAWKQKKRLSELVRLAGATLTPLGKAAISIFFVSSMNYVMIVSGMLETIAQVVVTPVLPLYSSFMGAFGAFLAGSATVSNLLFGALQNNAAQSLGIVSSWVLALQVVGAGAGNMIALSNLIAVQAAVCIEGKESFLIYRLLGPCLFYLMLASVIGAGFIWLF